MTNPNTLPNGFEFLQTEGTVALLEIGDKTIEVELQTVPFKKYTEDIRELFEGDEWITTHNFDEWIEGVGNYDEVVVSYLKANSDLYKNKIELNIAV